MFHSYTFFSRSFHVILFDRKNQMAGSFVISEYVNICSQWICLNDWRFFFLQETDNKMNDFKSNIVLFLLLIMNMNIYLLTLEINLLKTSNE